MKATCSRGHSYPKSNATPVCPVCWPGYYKKHDLPPGLGAPAIRALLHAKLSSLSKLSQKSRAYVSELHGMGPKGVKILHGALKKKGLSFAQIKN